MTSGEFPRLAVEAGIEKGEAEAIVANLDRVYGGGETPDEIAFRRAVLTHFRNLAQDDEWQSRKGGPQGWVGPGRRRFNTAPHAADFLLVDYPVMIRLLARDATPGLVGKTQYTRLRGTGGVGAL